MKNRPSSAPPSAAAPSPAMSGVLRQYLYLTAMMTGAAIMIVEILGAKMLSPFVGASHFVWTAQIAVTLVALACGYYVGGKLADRSPKLNWLYWSILGAAVYLILTVLICKPVAFWCLDFKLALGSLLASAILFFIPLALLAMTGPFLIRVITSSVAGVGGNVGRLTAIGTLGSFGGTLLIGYVLVPFFPNSVTMYGTAVVLMLFCLGYFLFFRRQVIVPLLLCLVVAAGAGAGLRQQLTPKYQWFQVRFEGNSHFGELEVLDHTAGGRLYLNDNLTQNTYDPVRKQSMSHFTYMLSGLARAYTTNVSDVLCIGLGIGIVPMDFAGRGARVDVVEINPAVVPVATRFFDLQTDKIQLTIDDGRHFLNRCEKRYDAVILDAFLGDSSPSHLLTREAFASIQRVLRPGGVLSINIFGRLHPGQDFFSASIEKTLKEVFASVRIHTSGDGGLFYVAGDRSPLQFVHAPELQGLHPSVLAETQAAYGRTVETDPESGIVLTDDYNPAEFYDATNREQTRRALAMSVKER